MIQWINNCWVDLDETIISESFISCGITCNNMDEYNSHLQEMLKTNIVPPNVTVESKTAEDDDLFLDAFVCDSDSDDDDFEPASDDLLSKIYLD
jgi:hypothetical protein